MPDKRILVFIDWFLPGYMAGGPVTSVRNLIDNLSDECRFMVVTRNHDYMSDIPYDEPVRVWINKETYDIFYLEDKDLSKQTIQKLITETSCDLVYINGIYSKYFSILPTRLSKSKPTIVAARGMLASSAIGIKSFKKRLFLFYARLSGLYRNVTFHATNDKEKDDIHALFPRANVRVAPNLFSKQIETRKILDKKTGSLSLLFLGRVAPEKNTLFAIQSLKSVNGDVVLNIAGSIYDAAYWEVCKNAIAELPDNIKVHHIGTINPAEVPTIIQQHHCVYLPSKGENFGHVVLESFLAGRPAIISAFTPWTSVASQYNGVVDISDSVYSGGIIDTFVSADAENYSKICEKVTRFADEYRSDNAGIRANYEMFGVNK